jgi:hypothetical protein
VALQILFLSFFAGQHEEQAGWQVEATQELQAPHWNPPQPFMLL